MRGCAPAAVAAIVVLFCVALQLGEASAGLQLVSPVEPACVSSPYGPRMLPNRPLAGAFHNGIDLPALVGSPVLAVAPGRIIRIHRHGVGGLEVLIQHEGFIGVYSHLGLVVPALAEGAKAVGQGQRIAVVGRSGLSYGPHLFFGMIVNGHSVDPGPYLHVVACSSAKDQGVRSSSENR